MSESGSEWTSDSEVGNDIASSQENDIASSQEVDNPSSQGGKAGKKCSLCFRLCGFDAPPADGHNAAGCVLVRHRFEFDKTAFLSATYTLHSSGNVLLVVLDIEAT